MIRVCDAIMGTGKSSAAITYMNEHKDEKFIYITPYLDEANRIKEQCAEMHFMEPSNKIEEFNFKKSEHTAALIKQGRNIATTHQAFKMYSDEMLEDIHNYGYRLIIDENMDVLERYDYHIDDIKIAIDAGYVEDVNGIYKLVRDDYSGVAFRELFKFMKCRDLVRMDCKDGTGGIERLFYWVLPPSLITSFKDVFILTYLFEGQCLHHFLEIYNLPYKYIGISKGEDGKFRFSDCNWYTPEYVKNLGEMIHIMDNEKLNSVGDDINALSMSWYDKNEEEVERLKRNVYNYANNIWRGMPSDEKMWGCFKSYSHKVSGKGYTKSFLTFNTKATNKYRDKHYLMYIVNIFMNVSDKRFYQRNGIEVDEDAYALSVMVQWIWRSAIRDGDEIYLYIPSSRMRTLLLDWIETTSKGGNCVNE